MSKLPPIINLKEWVEENRSLLKPPVGNKVIWKDGEYIAMVVGGPNSRKDYHYNETPELFYQIEGDITVKVMEDGKPKDVNIREGEMFLLPAKVPHSPQRGEHTIGLVIEIPRDEGVDDGLMWFCENCNNQLYYEAFKLKDIETDLPKIFDKYYCDKELMTCDKCGTVMQPPK